MITMKLSALLTWMVVAALTMATTSANQSCRFSLTDDSGCTVDDQNEIVNLLNMQFKQDTGMGKRDLQEENEQETSLVGLRATHAQDERELQCPSYCTINCNSNCRIECGRIGCRRRDLQSSNGKSEAAKFGQVIRDYLGTFGWNGCKPNKIKNMECDDV